MSHAKRLARTPRRVLAPCEPRGAPAADSGVRFPSRLEASNTQRCLDSMERPSVLGPAPVSFPKLRCSRTRRPFRPARPTLRCAGMRSTMMLLSQQALQVGTRVSPKWGSYRGDRTALMSKKSPDGRGGVAEMKASLDKKPTRSLTAADVCDRCSARAAVETVMMQGGSLLWCAHHFAFFEDALNAFGATILVDERRR